MSVNYRQSLKNTRMQDVLADIDNNASPASLEIGNAGFAAVLATIALNKPSFSRTNSVLTMLGVPKSDTAADATGTAALARIKDGAGTVILDGLTVGTSGTDIILNSTSLTLGQTFTITGGTISHA